MPCTTFDPSEGWVEFEGFDNTKTKKFTSQLHHFSRYAMFDGTGGAQAVPARYRTNKGDRDDPAETGK